MKRNSRRERDDAGPPANGQEIGQPPEEEPFFIRYVLFCLRLIQVVVIAWIALELPLPLIDEYLPLKAPLVCLVSVILIGKAVYDTFFYERFQP